MFDQSAFVACSPRPRCAGPKGFVAAALALLGSVSIAAAATGVEPRERAEVLGNGSISVPAGDGTRVFEPRLTILYTPEDPELALRRADLKRVSYNVPTWLISPLATRGDVAVGGIRNDDIEVSAGDGLDADILGGSTGGRSAHLYHAAKTVHLKADRFTATGSGVEWVFDADEIGRATAIVTLDDSAPTMTVSFEPARSGWYSIAYSGSPAFAYDDIDELWQPMIWHERRMPSVAFATAGYMASLPGTFVEADGATVGVVADAHEIPFQPLPLLDNTSFMVALRDDQGLARPVVFAPMLGGAGSQMSPGRSSEFTVRLIADDAPLMQTHERVSRDIYGYRDVRQNLDEPMNATLERIIEYGLSEYSRFREDLRGCSYDTDVPDAVKNVSSLHPLSLAIVTDSEEIYDRRALPIFEYLVSREKKLFNLDPNVRIQSPSQAMKGPAAAVSELAVWHGISGGLDVASRQLAESLLGIERTLNLDVVQRGDTWQSLMALGDATGDRGYARTAEGRLGSHVRRRTDAPEVDFSDPASKGMFFWTSFVPKFMDFYWAYRVTGDERLLAAAHDAARRYTTFTWMHPLPPEGQITVNQGGYAPHYWYLESKGHERMLAPERDVEAWKVSELGLTPESSGTAQGHRGIFMANYAPFMLRIAQDTGDEHLRDVARNAIVGRFRNFPGYHINTARTDVYMQADYPLREHKELGYNSMHYNHVWPMASILLDYLVADTYDASDGRIDFPGRFIEGYAYLQQLAQGDRPGRFYDIDAARLWMPKGLVESGHPQLNWISARTSDSVLVALVNQSDRDVRTTLSIDRALSGLPRTANARVWIDNVEVEPGQVLDGEIRLDVPARGIVALQALGASPEVAFQHRVGVGSRPSSDSVHHVEIAAGESRAQLVRMGETLTSGYLHSRRPMGEIDQYVVEYRALGDRHDWERLIDAEYPFEHRLPMDAGDAGLELRVTAYLSDGGTQIGEAVLRK
jgi:hypothetical protein